MEWTKTTVRRYFPVKPNAAELDANRVDAIATFLPCELEFQRRMRQTTAQMYPEMLEALRERFELE